MKAAICDRCGKTKFFPFAMNRKEQNKALKAAGWQLPVQWRNELKVKKEKYANYNRYENFLICDKCVEQIYSKPGMKKRGGGTKVWGLSRDIEKEQRYVVPEILKQAEDSENNENLSAEKD